MVNDIQRDPEIINEDKNWKKLRNVIKSVVIMKRPEIKKIQNDNDINLSMEFQKNQTCNLKQKSKQDKLLTFLQTVKEVGYDPEGYQEYYNELNQQNQISLALAQQKNLVIFNEYINRGSIEDINRIEFFIKNDPKRNLYKQESPELFKNKQDNQGKSPLYKACSLGNFQLVKSLLQVGANVYQKSIVSIVKYLIQHTQKPIFETPLEICCRQGYFQISEFILNSFEWDQKTLDKCIKNTKNQVIRKQLLKKLPKKSKKLSCISKK